MEQADAEHDTLRAMTDLLARQPEVRARLAEPERMRRLADDLAAGWRKRPVDGVPMLVADHFEVAMAQRRAGLVFEYGRPLPGEVVPMEEAMARVLAALETRLPRGRPLPARKAIERVVRQRYLDVEPWPFAGLVE